MKIQVQKVCSVAYLIFMPSHAIDSIVILSRAGCYTLSIQNTSTLLLSVSDSNVTKVWETQYCTLYESYVIMQTL